MNVLLGREATGSNVLAGYTQHPEAYRSASLGDNFLSAFPTRFGEDRRIDSQHPARHEDLDRKPGEEERSARD